MKSDHKTIGKKKAAAVNRPTGETGYMPSKSTLEKYEHLKSILRDCGSIAVAFSGGVDSTFLLYTAHKVLGDKAVAVTASSATFSSQEQEEAAAFCTKHGIRQICCRTNELDSRGFRDNPPNRCYLCKKEIFGNLLAIAAELGIATVADGSNVDDKGDFRPGLVALRELKIRSPLQEAGLSKNEIRSLSRQAGLPTWSKPSCACLASRFVYGESITAEKLLMVDRAEAILRSLQFQQFRVRIHGMLARIEVAPDEIERLMKEEIRDRLDRDLREIGFTYVTIDMKGYRTGSMNEALTPKERACALKEERAEETENE